MPHSSSLLTRRQFGALALSLAAQPWLAGCGGIQEPSGFGSALLQTRPSQPTGAVLAPGSYPLGLASPRDGQLLVPPQAAGGAALPLMVALHGAGGTVAGPFNLFQADANQRGYFLLAVESRGGTWDAINGRWRLDPAFIDQALAYTFAHCRVDPARIYLAGASDGATYALGLGLPNGDLFKRIAAFSPNAIAPSDTPWVGKPEVFVSHGDKDPILRVENSRDIIVPALRGAGYTVLYVEFDGGHEIPPAVAAQAMDWFARP